MAREGTVRWRWHTWSAVTLKLMQSWETKCGDNMGELGDGAWEVGDGGGDGEVEVGDGESVDSDGKIGKRREDGD